MRVQNDGFLVIESLCSTKKAAILAYLDLAKKTMRQSVQRCIYSRTFSSSFQRWSSRVLLHQSSKTPNSVILL